MHYFKLTKWTAAWGTMMLCSWLAAMGFPTSADAESPAKTDAYNFTLNGLNFTIDQNTGVLVRLAVPGVGALLETTPDSASIIDMAFPIKAFEPLRLASRFSQNAKIEKTADDVIISWDALGASRSLDLLGKVSVSIQFRAAADGKSVIMSCSINNQSQHAIPQVLFPDFMGLLPFGGEDKTLFRTGTETIRPFEILKPHPETVPFYATGLFHVGNGWKEYKSGGYKIFSQKLVDWLDFGDMRLGFSLFTRRWPPEDPQASVMLHRSEATGKLRLLFAHTTDIAPGAVWRSDDYQLTPRRHGWAEGIEPFREWVQQNMHRPYPMPEHIKKGMGFRTVWMAKGVTSDTTNDAIYRYRDLPRLARDARAHGLDEMVIWFWCPYLQLPLRTLDYLGSEQELVDAVAECKKIGVNVNLFISVLYLANPTASRYGLTPVKEMSWTYHPELIPHFQPPYATWNWSALAEQDNQQWQDDVLASCKKFIDLGLTSFVWDVFSAMPTQPNVYDLAAKIRDLARQRDPSSVFAGEGGCNIGQDYKYLDYTWNWNWNWPTYKDFRAFTSVFPAPRLNVNIDKSARVVKYCFADNAFMNIMPSLPDGINASDLIENHPALSRALKQCAKLRRQFLPYFVSGKLIGDCILTRACDTAHISAYVMKDRALMIMVKNEQEGSVKISCNPDYWLQSTGSRYIVKRYNSAGALVATKEIEGSEWQEETEKLKPLDIVLYEFILE